MCLFSDRDSMSQVRVPFSSLLSLLQALVAEKTTWAEVLKRFVVVAAAADETEGDASAAKTGAAVPAAAVTPVVVQYSTRGSFSRPNPAAATK